MQGYSTVGSEHDGVASEEGHRICPFLQRSGAGRRAPGSRNLEFLMDSAAVRVGTAYSAKLSYRTVNSAVSSTACCCAVLRYTQNEMRQQENMQMTRKNMAILFMVHGHIIHGTYTPWSIYASVAYFHYN